MDTGPDYIGAATTGNSKDVILVNHLTRHNLTCDMAAACQLDSALAIMGQLLHGRQLWNMTQSRLSSTSLAIHLTKDTTNPTPLMWNKALSISNEILQPSPGITIQEGSQTSLLEQTLDQ